MTEVQGQGPKTWWAGDSSPEDKRNAQAGAWLSGLVILVLCPLGIVTAGVSYLAFTRWRIRWTVIAQVTLLLAIIMGITGLLHRSVMNYIPSLFAVVESFTDDTLSTESAILSAILTTAPVALILGGAAGAGYCAFRWYRRAHWEEMNFRLTPWQWYKKRRNIRDIQEDKNGPRNGSSTLGISPEGERIVQTAQEAAAHSILVGASGTGKTTTALMLARDHIKQGNGYIFLDLKGSTDVPIALQGFAKRYGRRFQHFTFQDTKEAYTGPAEDGPSYYDPLARGNSSRRKDMLIAGRKWSDDYYKIITSAYLQTAFEVMIGSPPVKSTDALADIISLLDPANLADRARNLPNEPYYDEVKEEVHKFTAKRLDRTELSAIDGMLRELQTIRGSIAGKWLRVSDDPEKNLNLYRVADRGDVVVFSLDALVYPETARLIANLIISDLKTVTGEMQAEPTRNPLVVFIDEFSAIDSDGIIGLINKSRSAGMPISLATQALGDLRRVDPSFLEQLFGIINSFIIHRTNTLDDAETLAGIIGKEHKWEVRLGVEHTSGIFGSIGKGSATGQGMLDKVEDYVVSPHLIQTLGAGEVVYVAKSPKARVTQVKVIAESKDMTASGIDNVNPVHIRETPPIDSPTGTSFPLHRPTGEEHPHSREQRDIQEIRPTMPSKGTLNGRDLRAALGRETPQVQSHDNAPTPPPARRPHQDTGGDSPPRMPSLPRPGGLPTKPGIPTPNNKPATNLPRPPNKLPTAPKKPKIEGKVNRGDEWQRPH